MDRANSKPSIRLFAPGASADDAAINCRVAVSRTDYREAFRLVYRQYRAAGLIPPNPTGIRVAPHQLWPECTVILAEYGGRIVGTVSLVGDGPAGLPMDRLFPQAVESLRRRGLRLTEVSCLASVDGMKRFPSPVYAELTRATIHHARLGHFHRMLAAVHPRHGRFYARAMGFERLSEEVPYDLVNGSIAVCMAGNPHDASGYRQPWKDLFFDDPWLGRIRPRKPLSAADREYFEVLRKRAAATIVEPAWRAA